MCEHYYHLLQFQLFQAINMYVYCLEPDKCDETAE